MKNFVVSLAGLSVLLFLTACGTEVKTVEYYSEHLDEANTRDEKCNELARKVGLNGLSQDERKDCANARQALLSAPSDKSPWRKGSSK